MAKKPKPSVDPIVPALVAGVIAAVNSGPPGASEQSVVTFISRPAWRRWNVACGDPEDCQPTEWMGLHGTHRVFGSRTIVVESPDLFAVSYVPRQ